LAEVLMPQVRQFWLNLSAGEVQVQPPAAIGSGTDPTTLDLRIVTVLGKDSILAILNPKFIDSVSAVAQMDSLEWVLGVSINGEHRAYSLNLLSRHEVVNDTVRGTPIVVTW
jgi:hypothetical protein